MIGDSQLVTKSWYSPHTSGPRRYEVTRITPHCIVGHLSIESLSDIFEDPFSYVSAHYGVDDSGHVGQYVKEDYRPWTSSSDDNDNRAVTIECACDMVSPYAMTDTVWRTLVKLCADICIRYQRPRLIWIPDKAQALAYQVKDGEMLLTVHRWFSATDCPGDWLMSRMDKLAEEVCKLTGASQGSSSAPVKEPSILYTVQVGAFRSMENAAECLERAREVFPDSFIKMTKREG